MLRLVVLVVLCVGKLDRELEIVPRVEADIHQSQCQMQIDCRTAMQLSVIPLVPPFTAVETQRLRTLVSCR